MIIEIIKDGEKNVSVLIKGILREDLKPTPAFDISKVRAPREGWKGLRLDSAVWMIQEKMGMMLWWDKPNGEESMALVMESRNGVRYDEGVPSPRKEKGWSGVLYLSSFVSAGGTPPTGQVPKAFSILLDFDKQ